MKTVHPTIKASSVGALCLLTNLLLLAFTFYVHGLLQRHGMTAGPHLMDNAWVWFLMAFKFIGANLILLAIFSEFKIKSS